MELIAIENDLWKLLIAPEVGASIFGLYAHLAGEWQALLRETPQEALKAKNPSAFASFTLAPFSNRIKAASFVFLGQSYALKPSSADGNTQHGDVRGRPWQTLKSSETELVFGFDSKDFADFNFPFPLSMQTAYRLKDSLFITHLRLTNTGDQAMPAGFGIHPYFKRRLAGQEVQLGFSAEGLYEVTADSIPTAKVAKAEPGFDFSNERNVTEQLNHLYRDWSELRLSWPGLARLEISADAVFKHLIIFSHADGSLAVEPVSNATDGFNLMQRGFSGHGVKILQPGESLAGSIYFSLKAPVPALTQAL